MLFCLDPLLSRLNLTVGTVSRRAWSDRVNLEFGVRLLGFQGGAPALLAVGSGQVVTLRLSLFAKWEQSGGSRPHRLWLGSNLTLRLKVLCILKSIFQMWVVVVIRVFFRGASKGHCLFEKMSCSRKRSFKKRLTEWMWKRFSFQKFTRGQAELLPVTCIITWSLTPLSLYTRHPYRLQPLSLVDKCTLRGDRI